MNNLSAKLLVVFIALISNSSNVFSDGLTMENTKIKEIIVYKIKKEKIKDFLLIKDKVLKESSVLDGLHYATTSKILGDEYTYADTMIWDSLAASKDAEKTFPAIPVAAEFLKMWDGPPLHHLLMVYEEEDLE